MATKSPGPPQTGDHLPRKNIGAATTVAGGRTAMRVPFLDRSEPFQVLSRHDSRDASFQLGKSMIAYGELKRKLRRACRRSCRVSWLADSGMVGTQITAIERWAAPSLLSPPSGVSGKFLDWENTHGQAASPTEESQSRGPPRQQQSPQGQASTSKRSFRDEQGDWARAVGRATVRLLFPRHLCSAVTFSRY